MEQYNLGADDISDIQRWWQSRKAAGIEPQPWELERLLAAKYKGLYDKQAETRALGAEKERVNLTKMALDEKIRMNNELARQRVLDRAAMDRAAQMNILGQLGASALIAPYLRRGGA